jgi:hypothetical protein
MDGWVLTETWSRFLYKASIGSYKAPDMLTRAEMSFVAEKTGKDIEKLMPEEIDTVLQAMIPAECPFENMDDWLQQVKDWRCLPTSAKKRETPFHPREYYKHIWSKPHRAVESELAYDAATHCFHNWLFSEFKRLSEIEDEYAYNSHDVVAAMLFLITGRELSR